MWESRSTPDTSVSPCHRTEPKSGCVTLKFCTRWSSCAEYTCSSASDGLSRYFWRTIFGANTAVQGALEGALRKLRAPSALATDSRETPLPKRTPPSTAAVDIEMSDVSRYLCDWGMCTEAVDLSRAAEVVLGRTSDLLCFSLSALRSTRSSCRSAVSLPVGSVLSGFVFFECIVLGEGSF